MNMIKPLATKMVATFSLVALMATPASAQGLNAGDMAFAFGGKAASTQRHPNPSTSRRRAG
jgi:hypothetical protein